MDINFKKIKSDNFFFTSLTRRSDENFFESLSDKQNKSVKATRLNDYDHKLIENMAYQDISDEMFKIENKIDYLENALIKINNEIDILQSSGSSIQIFDLIERKMKIEKELKKLTAKYSELGLSSKISTQVISIVNFTSNKKRNFLSKLKDFIFDKILLKFSKKISASQTIKKSLDILSNINLNVNELINMSPPYGEAVDRYEKLTAYLNKANVIHSNINKNFSFKPNK
jgi:hypothetical protein